MSLFGIVADDLTGANTVGGLLTESGFRILTTVRDCHIKNLEVSGYDGIVVNSMSRGLDADAARIKVKENTDALLSKGCKYFCKRIDSTIRGNLGAEVEGMLSALGSDYIAICVPSYPDSGKVTIGGYLLANAVPVNRTAAGQDALKPVRSSYVPDVFHEQTRLPSILIPLSVVEKGANDVIRSLKAAAEAGNRIIVIDTASKADIDLAAQCVIEAEIKAVAVDPGPFTQALFPRYKDVKRKSEKIRGRVLIVAGSVSGLTRTQLNYLEKEVSTSLVSIDVRPFLDGAYDTSSLSDLAYNIAETSNHHKIFGFHSLAMADLALDLKTEAAARGISLSEISQRITYGLAKLAKLVLGLVKVPVNGVYLTGGDVTVSFCDELGAEAIDLHDEIFPHVSYGSLRGGQFAGLKIITKGGLIGKEDTAWQCVKHLI